ncbi:hypothetical protein RJ639_000958 [Escallonia herrerae]|uniref:Retrotransposon gag domain-containing protein n=1 Tax=Escallonia herrerae TaxID=1293975 RepID=A0AA88XA90_9ASTE|nr:hypothetical protein RJ639_000958 [Escallonia herrerae]
MRLTSDGKRTLTTEKEQALTWDHFPKIFLDKYFPRNIKDYMLEEFLKLEQGEDKTIKDYKARFSRLSSGVGVETVQLMCIFVVFGCMSGEKGGSHGAVYKRRHITSTVLGTITPLRSRDARGHHYHNSDPKDDDEKKSHGLPTFIYESVSSAATQRLPLKKSHGIGETGVVNHAVVASEDYASTVTPTVRDATLGIWATDEHCIAHVFLAITGNRDGVGSG